MAFDGSYRMTDADILAFEAKIKLLLRKAEASNRKAGGHLHDLHVELAALRQEVANDRGMDVTIMSGGDADDKDPPRP